MQQNEMLAAKNTFSIQADCLSQAFSFIDTDQFSKALDALAAAQRIATSGCGHSGIACQHMAHLMCCIGRPARFISPSEALHGAIGFVKPGDVMILASRGGQTQELIPILDICKKVGCVTIVVTENVASTLALNADIVLKMYITRETDSFNSQGTTSFTVLNVIFDALQAALIIKTGFTNEKFALVHPGGAVGERLNSMIDSH